MWSKDSVIDDTLLDQSSLDAPRLHCKYLGILNDYKLLLCKTSQQLKVIKHQRWMFYSGKEVPEGEEPLDYKILKGEQMNWVSVDKKVLDIESKIEYYQTGIDTLTEILKQLNNRNYVIKNAIDWRRFTSGF
jgi:hypothetical protein